MSRFESLRVEGGLLSPDLIDRIADGEAPGQKPADFGLPPKAAFIDEISEAWGAARRFWEAFRARLERLSPDDPATGPTRDQWVIPLMSLLGYDLTYRPKAQLVDGLTFAVSHGAGPNADAPPVHVVGWRQDLGKLPPSGRPRLAPHVLVQEYLNRTEHLWGVVTNGRILRLLRDSQLLSRQAYIEFDLEGMFEGERLSDFALLWRLAHRTRLPRGMDDAPSCLLESYYVESVEQGGRVRERLRDGVEKALVIIGNGFLSHPANDGLRERVATGETRPESFYRDLLHLIYRLLFLMVAEERKLISPSPVYLEHYSLERLRRLADMRLRGEEHRDLWISLQATFDLFRRQELGALLQVPPLNGELFEETELDRCALYNRDLLAALRELSTYAEDARSPRRRVNYSALNVEELGSVYESLLDYHPAFLEREGRADFRLVPGTERKATGSYYTPPELVNELVKSALEPVLAGRLAGTRGREEREKAILDIKVCDPACGSGHFLLAAARRLGKELARVRTGDEEPAPEEVRSAVREVIGHCIYGVDKNPLAVDLCKVALWIEGHAEGRPLTFLDHRIRCGDSLVGVFDLKVLEEGIPDGAFEPVADDDKALARSIKRDNKAERTERADWLSFAVEAESDVRELSEASRRLSDIPDDTPDQVRNKQEAYERLRGEGGRWWNDNTACHLWTSAFFARLDKDSYREKAVPTTEVLRNYLDNPASVDPRYPSHAWEAALRHRFFHWPLEFPEVFEKGGFDVVLCNPPWELIQLQEKEFFAHRDPHIASAPNSNARKKMIKELQIRKPALWREYLDSLHLADATRKFLRKSGRFRLTSSGRINHYSVFSELFSGLINPDGRAGVVVPTGIATDDTNKEFFSHLVNKGYLASLYDFENRDKIFPAIHSRQKFSLLTLKGDGAEAGKPARFAFFLTRASQLRDERRVLELTAEDFALLNPNTRTCPVFRTRQDAELTRYIYQRVPVLVNEATGENPWGVTFKQGLFNMSDDSHLFHTRSELEEAGFRLHGNRFVKGEGAKREVWLPLYEAKMIHQFDHRFGTYEGMNRRTNTQIATPTPEQHADPCYLVEPWYWVEQEEVNTRLGEYGRKWLLGFRDIARATDERTAIFTVIPKTGVGDTLPLLIVKNLKTLFVSSILSNFNAVILDFIAKQKIAGTHLNFFYVEQFPILGASNLDVSYLNLIIPRFLEQIYTSWDIKPFADDVWREADEDLRKAIRTQWEENKRATGGHTWDPPEWTEIAEDGIHLPPFKWDEERRARLRAQLDAIYARLYGLNRKQLRYILDPADLTEKELEDILDDYEEVEDPLDEEAYRRRCEASTFPGETFRVLKEKEIRKYGFYRTRRLVLEAWERLNERDRK
ncbi:MAG: N-6 DNA methylase [Actinobacteria bacterium]|nr:N-6 DNA methylase [Actinomycetota bacterium]